MKTTAKFTCQSKTQVKNWNANPEFIYGYKFSVVTGTSEENKQFFASTPGGTIELSAVRDDLFVPGKDYYLDFSPAE